MYHYLQLRLSQQDHYCRDYEYNIIYNYIFNNGDLDAYEIYDKLINQNNNKVLIKINDFTELTDEELLDEFEKILKENLS